MGRECWKHDVAGEFVGHSLEGGWKDLIAYTMDPDAWVSMKIYTTVTECIELVKDRAFKIQIAGISKLLHLHNTFNDKFLDVINN